MRVKYEFRYRLFSGIGFWGCVFIRLAMVGVTLRGDYDFQSFSYNDAER